MWLGRGEGGEEEGKVARSVAGWVGGRGSREVKAGLEEQGRSKRGKGAGEKSWHDKQ